MTDGTTRATDQSDNQDDSNPTRQESQGFYALGRPKPDVNEGRSRRRLLAGLGAAGAVGVAGCTGVGEERASGPVAFSDFRGSGPLVESRPAIDAPRIADLPDLSGELVVYIGGGEGGLYRDLIALFERIYDDFQVVPNAAGGAQQANKLIEEGADTPADVFWSVDAGTLSVVADEGLTQPLPSEVYGEVPSAFRPDDQWVGVSGRARAIPYNTNEIAADDIPSDVMAFPESDVVSNVGWAPTYSAFQAFVTAMRVLEGEDATRTWLDGMVGKASEFPDEFFVSDGVAQGAARLGFANHYYALRVRNARPDAPVDLAFTSGGPGALINVSGAAITDASDNAGTAETFVRHLLSAEAQEFFATRTFGYPTVPGVPPAGGLPRIDELAPPELDLGALSDLEPTLELLREVGVL